MGLSESAALLAAWEAAGDVPGHGRGPALRRALAGGAAQPVDPLDLPLDALARWLARCQVQAFGPAVAGVVTCSACGAILDVDADLRGIFAAPSAGEQAGEAGPGPQRGVGPGRFAVRAPNARDLIAASAVGDPRAEIVARCVRCPDGTAAQLADLADDDVEAIDGELERLVGPGMPLLRTACPDCEGEVSVVVDPSVLLWSAVETRAVALVQDVAELAAAFGWNESEVLALSPRRRAVYLELAGR